MTLHIKAQNSTLGSIWLKTADLRAAAKLESLSRASLRESEAAGFAKTTVLELPPGWNPYLGPP